jgi:capsular exopolysaccharide synthesis family protein
MDKSIDSAETIDFAKLKAIFLKNIFWVLLLFALSNLVAYLIIRYTKSIYEADSEIKLEVSNEANEFGITSIVEDQKSINLISGEIELIQSNLFLARVIDSLNLDVSYYSIGEFLNFELYKNSPFAVRALKVNGTYHNQEHRIDPVDNKYYELTLKDGTEYKGAYGKPTEINGFSIIVTKAKEFEFESQNNYSFILNDPQRLHQYFAQRLKVEPKNLNANTIRISFKEYNPSKAMDIVNKIVSVYLMFSNEQKNFANKHKIDWVNNELARIEEKMAQFEEYFKDFTLENKTQDLNQDLVRTVREINGIDTIRYSLNARLRAIKEIKLDLVDGKTSRFLSLSERQSLPQDVVTELSLFQKKQMEMEELKLSYKDQTFAYKELQQELQRINEKLSSQLSELETGWEVQLKRFDARKRQLENEFANMPDKTTEFTKNQRYYKLYEEFYFTLMQSRSEFEIAQAGTIPDFKILSAASDPINPISPNKLLITAAGFTSGLVLIFFFIGFLYVIDNKITSVHELERIAKVPILGIIPSFRNSKKESLPVQTRPHSMVSESIRTLRTNLDFFNKNGVQQQIIAVSSTVSGEGKSFVARNLAGVLAMSHKKVVLIDLDMRKPKDDQLPPFSNSDVGISSVLINKNSWKECVQPTSIENFHVIPSGPHPPNPSELLVNETFENLVRELKTIYDYIIIDTPPVGIVTDGIMAMKRADICIYIFRANYSKKEFLHNLKRVNSLHNFANVTAILNALPATAESYGYGYYHEEKKSKYFGSLFTDE